MASQADTSKTSQHLADLTPTPTTSAGDQVTGAADSAKDKVTGDDSKKEQGPQTEDAALAQKIGDMISNTLERINPLTTMINKVPPHPTPPSKQSLLRCLFKPRADVGVRSWITPTATNETITSTKKN